MPSHFGAIGATKPEPAISVSAITPVEQIEAAHAIINAALKSDLLTRLLEQTPKLMTSQRPGPEPSGSKSRGDHVLPNLSGPSARRHFLFICELVTSSGGDAMTYIPSHPILTRLIHGVVHKRWRE